MSSWTSACLEIHATHCSSHHTRSSMTSTAAITTFQSELESRYLHIGDFITLFDLEHNGFAHALISGSVASPCLIHSHIYLTSSPFSALSVRSGAEVRKPNLLDIRVRRR